MEPLPILPNVAAHLPAMARLRPDDPAIVVPVGRDASGRARYDSLTFRELDRDCDRYARGLNRVGIRRGSRVALMVKPSLEFFALTFALFKVGAVIVMIDPGIGVRSLGQCLAEAEPEAFIGITAAHAARVILRWARPSVRILVTVGPRLFWGGHRLADLTDALDEPYEIAATDPGDLAAILFTSGSTGPPKGAVYTHGIFSSQVAMLRETFSIEPGEIDLPTFPLFALFDPALGMTAVIPEMDFTRPGDVDPRRIIEAIEDHRVTNMFGSPALIDRVSRWGVERGTRLPTLRRVFSAGAPVRPNILERFRSMLAPEADVFTPYGATESLPVAAIESREALRDGKPGSERGEGICVGRVVRRMEARIIKISDDPISSWSADLLAPPGEIGEIAVKGPVVTREYWRRPDQTALAKIADGDAVWHRMGDLGRFDDQGRLWYCGRKSHRVVTAEGTLFTDPCEGIFNRHPKVKRTALVGVGARGSQRPVLCVELDEAARGANRDEVARELAALGAEFEMTRAIRDFLFHSKFPVDIRHNAKIGREKLAVWAADQMKRRGAA